MNEYAFDIKLFAIIRVKATSLKEARAKLDYHFQCVDSNFGEWPDGTPILAEASMDGEAYLYEINGEAV